ncbi:cytoplasmic dynein with WD40 domain [Phlyctochytrium planicorne]|nr:cytoplasmic dynein with WD40 domain [Phlyctochytrium planicorne]
MERTLLLIKPDAQDVQNEIIYKIKSEGFMIQERKRIHVSREQAQAFFGVLDDASAEKEEMVANLTSGPSTVLVLARLNAIDHLKGVLGPADLKQAKQFFPKSIRSTYAKSSILTAADGSESHDAAVFHINLFFPDKLSDEIPNSENSRLLLENSLYPLLTQGLSELCKVKPSNPTSQRRPQQPNQATLVGRTASTHSLRSNNGESLEPQATSANEDWLPPKVLLKPHNQLTLTEAELNEEHTRILNANNPLAPQNIARYNHKERMFKASPNVDHLVVHFEFDGYLIFKGEDAISVTDYKPDGTSDPSKVTFGNSAVGTPSGEGDGDDEKRPKGPLRNQFNFSERAAQSINNPYRERSTNTEPPPQKVFSYTVNQWSIYDAYLEDFQLKEKLAKEKAKGSGPAGAKTHKDDDKQNILPSDNHGEETLVYYRNPELRKAIVIIERMANQNTFDDIAQDYKYWEDASDELGDKKSGTLLPLWKFVCEKEKRKQVTSLCWNPQNPDLFSVGYGSYEFSRQGPGMIACFSLKNPSYPEFLYVTESGVMCLDFHPQHPNMIAVGLYDGTVLVFNLQKKSDQPLFKSLMKSGKHTDPVWQVCWQKDDLDDNANFFSISSDGRVAQWTLLQNELVYTDVIRLRYDKDGAVKDLPAQDDEPLFGLSGGCCFDFHKTIDHLFVVGTEEGRIHKCSKSYSSQYLLSFEGHQMAVYTVRYNPFHGNVFLSASADWTVRLWEHNTSTPIMSFDLGSSVGDVAWAPYSSTVFAAATADGKVFVFDLNENKYEPICEQQVAKKAKLTHISFNPFEPIVLVGDDKGSVISLKLSPNLRKRNDNDFSFLLNANKV